LASTMEYHVVRYIVRKALRLQVDESMVSFKDSIRATRFIRENPNFLVVTKKGMLYCGICGRGPFTRRGLYLHLMRVHADDIARAIESRS